jgi:hypothetical protein
MAEGDTRHATGVDSYGNRTVTVATVGPDGKVRTSTVRATGNAEQDQEKARRAGKGSSPQDSSHLKDILGG